MKLRNLIHAVLFSMIAATPTLLAQFSENAGSKGVLDSPLVIIGRASQPKEDLSSLPHPYTVVARHPKAGCFDTAKCGEEFFRYEGHNLRTSAGITWQGNIMADTVTPPVNNQANYMALTNTAITPAMADTTLSGEIASNGLSRAQGTFALTGTTLAVPTMTSATPVGTTGATTYYYWAADCQQGICTTPAAASVTTATANATLSATNAVNVIWTSSIPAATHQLYRTTSNTAPSGTVSVLVGGTAACSTSGTVVTCTQQDVSNTLTSVAIPSSNLTGFGAFTLVHTWTATATQSAQAFGIFTASSGGTLCFEGTFTTVTLNTNDTLQLTETVYY